MKELELLKQVLNIYIITCGATKYRLPKILDLFSSASNTIFIRDDFKIVRLPSTSYKPELWSSHHDAISTILKENMIGAGFKDTVIDIHLKNERNGRNLSLPEHDIFTKIIWSIAHGVKSGVPYIMICEDDLTLLPNDREASSPLSRLGNAINAFIKLKGNLLDIGSLPNLQFYDNNNPFLAYRDLISSDMPLIRSCCCFILSRQLAEFILEKWRPYSLPIDFHLQYLLNTSTSCITPVSSYLLRSGIVCNGSMFGLVNSSIQ